MLVMWSREGGQAEGECAICCLRYCYYFTDHWVRVIHLAKDLDKGVLRMLNLGRYCYKNGEK